MALLFMDGFDYYNANYYQNLGLRWDYYPSSDSVAGRYGGLCAYASISDGNADRHLRKFFPNSTYTTLIVGQAVKAGVSYHVLRLYPSNGEYHVYVTVENGYPKIYNSDGLVATSSTQLSSWTWNYWEVKHVAHASSGSVEVKLNGNLIMTYSGKTLRPSTNAYIEYMVLMPYNGTPGYVDDVYVCDTTGSTNNTFLGDVRVQAVLPTGAGNSTQLTASSGSNYQCVDDSPFTLSTGDTDYVSSATVGQKDTYAFGDLSITYGTVLAVQSVLIARKDDSGARAIAPVTRIGTTDTDGTSHALSASYVAYADIQETKPGGSAWSIADVNGAEFGVKITS